jgi:hypothetical protein
MVSGGNEFEIVAMSPTVSTSMCAIATTAVTTTSASKTANDFSGLMKWNTAHAATAPAATASAAGCHRLIWASASTNLPIVLPLCGL